MTLRVESAAAGALLPPDFAGLHAAQGYGQKDEPLWEGAEALLAWAKARPGPAALTLHLIDGPRKVVQRAGLKVAVDPEGLRALEELGLEAWL